LSIKYFNKYFKGLIMPIVEIRTHKRPNSGTSYWSESKLPELSAATAAIQSYITDGKLTLSRVNSDDELTVTQTLTYDSLETYSAVDTIFGIALNAEFVNYASANGITGISNESGAYQQTGIDQPFTCTTTFTFSPTATMSSGQLVSEFLVATIPGIRLTNMEINPTSIVATFQFENSADYSTNAWLDVTYCVDLHAAGVTRSYSYSLVTG